MIKKALIVIILLSVLPSAVLAQEMSVDEEMDSTYTDIYERMMMFQEEVIQLGAVCRFRMDIDSEMPLTDDLLEAIGGRLRLLSRAVNSFTTRWDAYSQAQQVYIADNDSLLNKLADIQQMGQMVSDSLASRQQQYDQLSAFSKAEKLIWGQDRHYRKLYRLAAEYSLSPKLAAKLEKVKAEDQALFADIETQYTQAKTAAETFPGLNIRMEGLGDKFFQLQSVSVKIQAMEYKPFIQRIKDYLIGLAAVAILLMFVNLMNAKIKTIKQAREQTKKMNEMLNGQHNYPTI